MEWLILLNVFFVFFSWHIAQQTPVYSGGWWLNMTASALNAVIALRFLL